METNANAPATRRAALGLGAALCVAFAVPAAADTIRCKAIAGTPTVTLEIAGVGDGDIPGAVSQLDADLGDFTLSTHPTDSGAEAERIESQVSGPGRLDLNLTDPGDVWIVLRLRLVRDVEYKRQYGDETDENARSVVAGTLSVMGAGVWAVTCEGW
ncbi:MAG: hypothetical protein KDK07_21075 [Bauldia sp.]|nr:hypothetical protein [Bauldia sp.]